MKSAVLKVKRLKGGARLTRATDGSAGLDLHAVIDGPVVIRPGKSASVPTGIAIEPPGPGYVGLVFSRSGMGVKHGVSLANSVGVIDSDYRGEIVCTLINHGREPYTVNPGDRIAQLVVMTLPSLEVEFVEELGDTDRGSGGFGHTGR